jgi:hypothetical protein
MEPAHDPGPGGDEIPVPIRPEPQHSTVISLGDRTKPPMPQRHHRRRAGVMTVGLVPAVQQPRPRRERRRHIHHGLTRRDQLLGQQRTPSRRRLDRPGPRREPGSERQQLIALARSGLNAQLAQQLLVTVERRRGVRPLVRVDPDHEHLTRTSLSGLPAVLPRWADLMRATSCPLSSHTTTRTRRAIIDVAGGEIESCCGAGAVDQQVEAVDVGDRLGDGGGVGHVEAEGADSLAVLNALAVTAGGVDVCGTGIQQRLHEAAADPARGAGDQCGDA